MDIKLAKDELAIVKWIYDRASSFGKESGVWASPMKKDLTLSDERYHRAVSVLRELGLADTRREEYPAGHPQQGDVVIYLTGAGVLAYRHLVEEEEWDIIPERFTEGG